jgi:hypothetical protein
MWLTIHRAYVVSHCKNRKKIMLKVIMQKKSIKFQHNVKRMSDNAPKQWKQLSLAILCALYNMQGKLRVR